MLGENIRQAREAKGMTQEQLAAELHVVRQTISKWEKGTSAPDADFLLKVAEVLNVSTADLIGQDAVQTKSIEELTLQTAVLNEQVSIQNRRIQSFIKRRNWAIVACICAVVLAVGIGFFASIAPSMESPRIEMEYEYGGKTWNAQIMLNPKDPGLVSGYSWPPETKDVFMDEDGLSYLEGFLKVPTKPEVMLHAMETLITENGGTVKRITAAN